VIGSVATAACEPVGWAVLARGARPAAAASAANPASNDEAAAHPQSQQAESSQRLPPRDDPVYVILGYLLRQVPLELCHRFPLRSPDLRVSERVREERRERI
jgi:hypothetical protein